jgi:hypothetical protein
VEKLSITDTWASLVLSFYMNKKTISQCDLYIIASLYNWDRDEPEYCLKEK